MAQTKSCAINPVKVHFINGMFNSEQDVIKTHERLRGIFLFNSDNRKKVDWLNLVDVDYSHNQSLVVYSNGVEVLNTPADLVKVLGNKIDDKFGRNDDETWAKFAKFYFLGSVGEGADIDLEYAKFLQENLKPDLDQLVADQSIRQQDLLKMAGQLSPYIENRDKVLLISHSQGNFFADDLMNVMLPNRDDPNSVSGDRFKFWGNLQLASPVSNPVMASSRYRSMKFTQDLIANQFLGQPGTHSLVRSSAGDFFKTLSGHNAAYFLSEELLTDRLSDNRRGSPLSFVLEHLSAISDQFPSNCAPMEPSFEVTTSNLSKSGKFVAKYSTVDINYQTINFGNDIIDLSEADRTKLISEFHVQDFDRVDLECINVDENPYFCDEPLTREPASIRLNSTSSNPNLIVKNTFGESVQVPLRNIASDLVVYNGNEDIFIPKISYSGPNFFKNNVNNQITIAVEDIEFPAFVPVVELVGSSNISLIKNNDGLENSYSVLINETYNAANSYSVLIRAVGKFGAIAEYPLQINTRYCPTGVIRDDGTCDWPLPQIQKVEYLERRMTNINNLYSSLPDDFNTSNQCIPDYAEHFIGRAECKYRVTCVDGVDSTITFSADEVWVGGESYYCFYRDTTWSVFTYNTEPVVGTAYCANPEGEGVTAPFICTP